MFVLGTAGHIDHGKSMLVKALTGIDPDRLKEEKERGMTIELGFAWLRLPSGREVSLVDVPGHERFVRHMVAGAGGIDVALLIIAANEGVMPQTREHLAILDLLGVKRGIIVITKKDLVDAELLDIVRMEAEELISGTTLEGSPVVSVSALTGEGLDELTATIDRVLDRAEPRPDLGRPRLPVDRVFTIAGAGTVVTGTLIDGSLAVGDEVELLPSGLAARIRGLQSHRTKIERALPGSRVAVNLSGVAREHIERGDVLASPGWLKPSGLLTVKLRMIPYVKHTLRHGSEVSFHCLAAETTARVRLLDSDEVPPGAEAWAQLLLARPLAVLDGDRFIIRSPVATLGGGSIIDTRTKRLRRNRPEIIANLRARGSGAAADVIMAVLEGQQPLGEAELRAACRLPPDEFTEALAALVAEGRVVVLGEERARFLLTAAGWENLRERMLAVLGDYHRRYPARPGMPKAELGTRLRLGSLLLPALENLTKQGLLVDDGGQLRLPSHRVQLTASQQAQVYAFLKALAENPYAPPSDLIPEADLLNLLVSQGKVVRVADNVVFAADVYREMVARVTGRIREKGKVTLGEVRDMFGTSRKYAQALLEYLDREKITRRVGDDRVLYQP